MSCNPSRGCAAALCSLAEISAPPLIEGRAARWEALCTLCRRALLEADPGGPHANGVRHAAALALGALVAWLHIQMRFCRLWYKIDMETVMKTCVIIHSMVLEAFRDKFEICMAALGMFDDTRSIFQGNPQFAGK